MNEKKIIPAIIAKSQDELNKKLARVINHVDIIQLDIMDNDFVPNMSIFFDFELPKNNCIFEAHLMMKKPEKWIRKYFKLVDTILVHFESEFNPKKLIEKVKEENKKIGFVLNPQTPIEKIKNYLGTIDQVLIMTVNPGFYGSPFLPETLEKVKNLRDLKPDLDIEVDGGITEKTIMQADRAGANMFVSGSYIVKSDNVKKAIYNLKRELII